jgi:hypothetical protein
VPAAQLCELFGDRPALLELPGRVDEESWEVIGDRLLELQIELRGHRDRDEDHRRPCHGLDPRPVRPKAIGDTTAPEHDQIEDRARADRVGQRDGELARREVLCRRNGDHAREDRAGARRVDEAEARTEDQARAEAGAGNPCWTRRDPRPPRFDPVADRG